MKPPSPRTAMLRRKKLADFLRKLPKDKFDFYSLVSEWNKKHTCGTVCCAIGWMPKVFNTWKWDCGGVIPPQGPGQLKVDGAMEHFRLTEDQAWDTFWRSGTYQTKRITPTQVADRLMAWPRPKE